MRPFRACVCGRHTQHLCQAEEVELFVGRIWVFRTEVLPAGLPPAVLIRIRRGLTVKDCKAIGLIAVRYYEFVESALTEAEPEAEPIPYGPTPLHDGRGK